MYIIYLLSHPSSVAKSIGRALYLFLHSLLLFILSQPPITSIIIIIIIIIIILYRNLNNVMNRPLPFIFGHHVAWIGKTIKFQYTNDSSFGHI